MKNNKEGVTIIVGKHDTSTTELCRSMAKEGINAIVKQKEPTIAEVDDASRQWSGQPGKDLFFNGWKLLF